MCMSIMRAVAAVTQEGARGYRDREGVDMYKHNGKSSCGTGWECMDGQGFDVDKDL